MKKFMKWFSIPRDTRDIFPWLLKLALSSSGASGVFGFIALLIVGVTLFGFLHGDYTSTGAGKVTQNGLQLTALSSNKDKALLTHYNEVADEWQQGLSQAQIGQVQQAQADVPGAVLLAIGKLVNNFNPAQAHEYMKYLMPQYTWKTFDNVTITHHEVKTRNGMKCVSKKQVTPITMLATAHTWDGVLTNTYHFVTSGSQTSCAATYSRTIQLDQTHRTYSWQRVWNLFAHIHLSTGDYLQKNKANQGIIAGLIGAVDYSISDPYVQEMVSTLLFNGAVSTVWNGHVQPASGNTIHNILRWKTYIDQAAKTYQVPAVLIAGVMYQESSGRERNPNGTLSVSPTGAIGLMQVEPSTAAGLTLGGTPVGGAYLADLSNPVINIELGSEFLSELYHSFGNNVAHTLAAYNAGPGAENEAIAKGEPYPPYAQTIQYVHNISGSWIPALTAYFGAL